MPFFEIYNKNMYIFGLWIKIPVNPLALRRWPAQGPKPKQNHTGATKPKS